MIDWKSSTRLLVLLALLLLTTTTTTTVFASSSTASSSGPLRNNNDEEEEFSFSQNPHRRALLKRSKFALTTEEEEGGGGSGTNGNNDGGGRNSRRENAYFDSNKYAADDALARMYGNVNKNARPKFTATNPTQDKAKVERAAKMQAEEVAKGDETAIAFKNMESEIEEEAKEAVEEATNGDLELLGTTLRSSENEVTYEEKQRWSFMDSSQLRAELVTMTKERNKLAAALGKLATNCSQEMKMLFYKVENLEDTQKFYEKENEQLTGKHEKCKNDHDLLKDHAAKKVVKHMNHLGVDTTFVKPHRMDVKELLEAAELADKHHEDELFKRRMELEEREGKQHSLEDLARAGKKHDKEYKKRMKERVEGYRFKTIHREEEEK
jgi:hypothetical protein